MAGEQLAYLTARLTLDTSALDKARQRIGETNTELGKLGGQAIPAEGKLQKLRSAADDLGKVGAQLSTKITLPLVAVGAAATKLSIDFDQAFAKMRGLAGVTAGEVDGLKKSVLGLAAETGRGPQELANALYFARSAGLSAADAMETVRTAAKAAAAGLGDSKVIVDAVTSAIGAYGAANLSASRAGDILVAAARAAKIEASELAPQLGRLLPTANSLGISFDQVAGAMAFLSQKSGDASLSATQLDSVFRKLLIPSTQGKKALEEVGLTAEDLRRTVSEQGLAGALDLLKSKFGGNIDALAKVFDDIQALQGAQLLLADSTGNLGQILDSTSRSAGALGDAFGAVASTDGFKAQQAFAQLKVALIQIGDVLLPLVGSLASFASSIIGAFSKIPGPVLEVVVALAGLAAALGPLLLIGSNVVKTFSLLQTGLGKLAGAFTSQAAAAEGAAASTAGASAALGPLGVAVIGVTAVVTVATLVFGDWAKKKAELKAATNGLVDSLKDEATAIDATVEASIVKRLTDKNQLDQLNDLGLTTKEFTAAVLGSVDAQQNIRRRIIETGQAQLALAAGARGVHADLAALTQQFIETGVVGAGTFIKGNEGIINSLNLLVTATKGTADQFLANAQAIGALTDEQRKAIEVQATAADGTVDYAGEIDAARKATAALNDKTVDASKSTKDFGDATDVTAASTGDLIKALHDAYDAIIALLDPTLASEQANRRVEDALAKVEEAQKKANKAKKDGGDAARELTDAELSARDAFLSGAAAYAESQAKLKGLQAASDDTVSSLQAQLQWFETIRATLAPGSPLIESLDSYISKLKNDIPKEVRTQIELVIAPLRVGGKIVNSADALERSLPHFASGGYVDAPRGRPVPAIVHGGELVIDADTIAHVKGQINGPAVPLTLARAFQLAPGAGPAQTLSSSPPALYLRVFIGSTEIKDIVKVEIDDSWREAAKVVNVGVRGVPRVRA